MRALRWHRPCGVAQPTALHIVWVMGQLCVSVTPSRHRRRKVGTCVGKRLSVLLFLVVIFLTVFAFTAGSGSAQTTGTGSASAGTGTAAATRAATVAPTVAATATRAATVAPTVAATGTGGATTTTTLPATGQTRNGSMNAVIIEVMLLALAIIGTGVALKRRASRS